MTGERSRISFSCWVAVAASLVPFSAATTAGGAERPGQAAEGQLVLAGGDHLRGTPVESGQSEELAWRSSAFVEPLRFPLSAVQMIKFDAPTTTAQGEYRFELPGGDELHGTLVSVDRSDMAVATRWGTWRLKRAAVVSVSHLHRALRRRVRPAETPVAQKAHVVLATNRTVYAELVGYEARSTTFSFQAQGAVVTYRANDIAEIVLADARPNRDPVQLECSDGTRLSGELANIGDGKAVVKSSSLAEQVTVPLAALRSIRGLASSTATRRSGDALFMFREDRLRGRLVAAQGKAGQTSFAWQPAGSTHASPIRTGTAVSIDFGSSASAVLTGERSYGDDRVFLRSGDVIRCRISTIDDDDTVLRVAGSEPKRVSNARIKAVELGPHSRGSITDDKLARLLTVPRLQKEEPPTHVLGSLADDYLRGRLIAVEEKKLLFQVGTSRREFPRERIACIVWLDAVAEPLPHEALKPTGDLLAAGVVHVTDVDGLSLSLAEGRLDEGAIVGTNHLLGECRLPIARLGVLRIGPGSERTRLARRYVAWKLTDAVEPKAFVEENDAEGQGHADESELVGRLAPPFAIVLLNGAKLDLPVQRGKVVVLDFWASWCAPCMRGLRELSPLAAEFDSDKVRFIAVNLQETREDAAAAAARLKLNVPVALDVDGRVAAAYGAASIPYAVVIGPDGKVARAFAGYGPWLAGELKEAISQALANAGQKP